MWTAESDSSPNLGIPCPIFTYRNPPSFPSTSVSYGPSNCYLSLRIFFLPKESFKFPSIHQSISQGSFVVFWESFSCLWIYFLGMGDSQFNCQYYLKPVILLNSLDSTGDNMVSSILSGYMFLKLLILSQWLKHLFWD